MFSPTTRAPTIVQISTPNLPIAKNRFASPPTSQSILDEDNYSRLRDRTNNTLTDYNLQLQRGKIEKGLNSDKFCHTAVTTPSPSRELSKFKSSQVRASSQNRMVSNVKYPFSPHNEGLSSVKRLDKSSKQEIQCSALGNIYLTTCQKLAQRESANLTEGSDLQIPILDNAKGADGDDGLQSEIFDIGQINSPTHPQTTIPSRILDLSCGKITNYDTVQRGDSPTIEMPESFVDDDEITSCEGTESTNTSMNYITSFPTNTRTFFKGTSSLGTSASLEQNNILDGPVSRYSWFEENPSLPGAYIEENSLLCGSLLSNRSLETPLSPSDTSDLQIKIRPISHDYHDVQTQQLHVACDTYEKGENDPENPLEVLDKIRNRNQHSKGAGDNKNTAIEEYCEFSHKCVLGPKICPSMYTQDISSKHSSWHTDYSAGIDGDLSGKIPSTKKVNISSDLDGEILTTYLSKKLPVVPSINTGNHSIPSLSFQNINSSPQLPPVSTGEGFTLSFSRSDIPHSPAHSENYPIQKRTPDCAPPPPLNLPKSVTVPARRSSSSISSIPRPLSSSAYAQNTESRPCSGEPNSQKCHISTLYLLNDRNNKRNEIVTLDTGGTTTTHPPETDEEKRNREENRKRLYQRKMAIKELIDTEAVYFKDMNVVEEIYKGTAEACPNLEASDIKIIFRNTEEIVSFSNKFLEDLKLAALPIYSPRGRKLKTSESETSTLASEPDKISVEATFSDDSEEQRDRETFIGASFSKHLPRMQVIYTNFLKNSESATSRLLELQKDTAVKVWLGECNTVAKDLTAAWDLDALLVKPVQRITRYQLLLKQIQSATPDSHPDSEMILSCCQELSRLLKNIDDLKRRIHVVAKIVGRKRKESDVVRTGIAKAFGRRSDKLNNDKLSSTRAKDDEDYLKLTEKFGDDYLRLQVVLRDAEYYTRQISIYVSDYIRFFSVIELIMRMSATGHPEIEGKWARFNVSMREIGTLFVEDHISEVRKFVIEPFEKTISAYDGPLLAMKKRDKRKIDFEKAMTLKAQGKKIDEKLQNLSNEYSALHETLKWELPKLSQLTENIGRVILERLIHTQAKWYKIWVQKVQSVLELNEMPRDVSEIINQFKLDFSFEEARLLELGIINGSFGCDPNLRISQSRTQSRRVSDVDSISQKLFTESAQSKQLGTSFSSYRSQPSLSFQSSLNTLNTPHVSDIHTRRTHSPPTDRYKRRSFTPDSSFRTSNDYSTIRRRESVSTYGSHHDGPFLSSRPSSGIFHSALPLGEGGENSRSRGSSRDRNISRGYTVLYLAASLFEFNVSATKQEAGYPYLTYQAGEIFDVIGEKGELWLAKNQDDASDTVGWIWSKHFARLAAS